MDDNEKKRDEIKEDIGKYDWGLFIAIGVGVFLFFLTFCFPCIQNQFWKLKSTEVAGEFGDQFGSLNTLFSGLAFTALIYTIYLQRRDLKMQQEAFQKENANAERQRFNSLLFNSINLLNDAKKSIYLRDFGGEEFYGSSAINKGCLVVADIMNTVNNCKNPVINYYNNTMLSYFLIALRPWMNCFNFLIKEILNSPLSNKEKDFFVDMIIGLTTNQERSLMYLFFYTQCNPMYNNIKDILGKSDLFYSIRLNYDSDKMRAFFGMNQKYS